MEDSCQLSEMNTDHTVHIVVCTLYVVSMDIAGKFGGSSFHVYHWTVTTFLQK